MRVPSCFACLTFLGLACGKSNPTVDAAPSDGASAVAPTALPVPTFTGDASREAAADAGVAPVGIFQAFGGKLGAAEFRLAFERTGKRLEGLYVRGDGEDLPLRGDVTDDGKFVLTELAEKGKKPASFEGRIDGARLIGTFREPSARGDVSFSAGPLDAFGAATTFDQAYLGAVGNVRVRVKLQRRGAKLDGTYRYTRSKEDLVLSGTVDEGTGRFELTESAKGKPTGKWSGVMLRPSLAFGRWRSPDGAKTFPLTLRLGDAYPEPVALPGRGRIVAQEDYREESKFCASSVLYPELEGTGNLAAEKAANKALREAAGGAKIACDGATEELRYEKDTSFSVTAVRPTAAAFAFSFYEYSGGAHPNHAAACTAVDLASGAVTALRAKLLSPDARKTLATKVNADLKRQYPGQSLTEAGFFTDEVPLGPDTTLCVEAADTDASKRRANLGKASSLVVLFQPYEVAPYVMGSPSVTLSAKDVAPLVVGTALEAFFR